MEFYALETEVCDCFMVKGIFASQDEAEKVGIENGENFSILPFEFEPKSIKGKDIMELIKYWLTENVITVKESDLLIDFFNLLAEDK